MLLELFMCTADSAVLLAEVAEQQQLLKAQGSSYLVQGLPLAAASIHNNVGHHGHQLVKSVLTSGRGSYCITARTL